MTTDTLPVGSAAFKTEFIAVIPPKSNRKEPQEYDRDVYKRRNLIERAFNRLKHWRRIATRYDRRSLYLLAALHLAAAVIWSI